MVSAAIRFRLATHTANNTPPTTAVTRAKVMIVVYCRRRYADAPSCTAPAISRIRSFPSGCRSSQIVSQAPYATATPAQTSARSTA